jgi:hypothetical protein
MATHVKRLAIQPLSPGLLALLQLWVRDERSLHQDGNEQLAAAVRENSRELFLRVESRGETEDLLRRLRSVWKNDEVR